MKVYKFGGASVRSAEGVRNLCDIVRGETGDLFVIVSAMGKTTNALEHVLEQFMAGDREATQQAFAVSETYHREIIAALFDNVPEDASSTHRPFVAPCSLPAVEELFGELKNLLDSCEPKPEEYELWYDRIVSYGELLSTTIISEYLNHCGLLNRWIDMRQCFITDARHRDADIDIERSAPLLKNIVYGECPGQSEIRTRIFIGQGFIGGTPEGEPTTLGREGSDYSAAVAAHILDAESLTIWKDVEGILNADPKIFPDTVYIPELTYLDAIELAYSGAQIIHPKTIKPLQNKHIPLYVRPFGDKTRPGSVIKGEIDHPIDVPILILKHNQVLLSIRPNDFSFVLEDRFAGIFSLLERYNVKINLIQSSAVNLSLCVDRSRHLEEVVNELHRQQYRVVYNSDMELLTIRGYTSELCDKYDRFPGAYLTQKTRKIVRIVRKKV